MRLVLGLLPLLSFAAAQVETPAANTTPAAAATTPQAKVGSAAAVTSINANDKQAAASTSTPNSVAAATSTRTSVAPNAGAAQTTTAAPTQTSPTFQFDMNSASVYTACQTQDVIWHYHPNPETKNITIYVYNEGAAEANNVQPIVNQDPEPTGVLPTPTPNSARRSLDDRSEADGLFKRQSGTRISQRIVSNWPANVAYRWVVDVPPGQYKFMAIVDGMGGDISYPLEIVSSSNTSCVKDFSHITGSSSASSSTSSARPTSSAFASSIAAGAAVFSSSSSAAPSSSASHGGNVAAAGASSGKKSGGISGGAIAGIVIGVLAGVALLALLAFCCWRRRREKTDSAYRVDPYSEPMRERRSGGGFAPMSSSNDHDTSSFGHVGDDAYGGIVAPPPRAAAAVNPFDTEPSTPVNERQMASVQGPGTGGTQSQSSHTPNSSTGNASVYTSPMGGDSDLAFPPPVGLLTVPGSNRASAQSGTSTFESALTQIHPDSMRTFGPQNPDTSMSTHPSSRTLASSEGHFVDSDAPALPQTSPKRLPPVPPSANISGGAPAPSAFGAAGAAAAGAAAGAAVAHTRGRSNSFGEEGGPTLERKISTRRKPVPQLNPDEEAALGSSPHGSESRRGSSEATPKFLGTGSSSEGHVDEWGAGLQSAINGVSQQKGKYTLAADPPLRQD